MENGVGVVDERGLDEIPEEEREGKGVLAVSDEVKASAGGEIFEEAIEAPALLPEGEEKVGSVYENDDMAVVDGNFNVEDEKFEEPSGVPVEVENFEDAASGEIEKHEVVGAMMNGEEKVGDLVGGVSTDEAVGTNRIDKGGTGNETTMLGSSDFKEDRLVGEGERKEEPDVDVDGEDKLLGASNHEDKISGVVIEQSESQDPDDEDLVEMPEITRPVNLEIDRVVEDVHNLNHRSEHVEELKENGCVELQDEKPRDLADTFAGTQSFLRDETNEELKGNLAKLDTEHQVDESAELKDVPCSLSSANLATVHQDQRYKKVEVSLAELDTQNHVGTCELKDTLADLSTSVDKVTVTPKNETPEKPIIEDKENIQSDSIDLKAEDSDYSDEIARKEEKTPEKSIMEDTEIQDEATSLRANDFVEDIAQEKEKSREKIQENATSLREENSNFSDKTANKEEADETAKKEEKSIIDKDGKIKDDSTGVTIDGSDCANDSAREEEDTPEKSITEKIEEGASSSRSVNSDFAAETAHKLPNNHVLAEESGKKEEEAKKESIQAKGLPDFQPASQLASSSGKFTKPASSPAPSPARPAGLGRAAPLLDPAPRVVQQPRVNGTASQMQTQHMEDSNGESEEYDETREKLQMIRVKFLRLAHRLGQTPHNVVVAQVLYRLGLAEQLRGSNGGRVGAFSFDRASAMAEQLEAAGQEPLDFSCTIMVLGKTGVGKSATINSIFDAHKLGTDAFEMGTKKVQDVVGTVQGIKVRVIDTPGLLSSWSDQRQNEKILRSVKQFIKKTPPDIVLYLDRLDMQSRDFGDMPLLRTITQIFGASIWFNAIVVLTHAASAPPDGPNGTASSYDMFVTQRSHVVQQAIRQAAGDMRLMNPVSLVENHSACRTNRAGQRVLPNGQVWKPHLLLLSFASKILAEANTLLKLQDSSPGKPSATRTRAPPLPFLLSSLLQSRPQLKLPGELGDEDDDLAESSDSDSDEESEYDELPPFTPLTKAQVTLLSKAQRKAYFDELAYRERLFMKKQLKEEKRQRRTMKRMADLSQKRSSEDKIEKVEEESSAEISPAPMPDLALPASFDSSNPAHRYRCLDSVNQWVVRPVLDTHGWDHDVGYEGINVERFFVVKDKLPVAFSGQASKDKKDLNIQMEINSSLSHGEGKSTSMGFDLQTLGKDMSYTMRGETKFCNHRRNKATAGLSLTLLGDALSTGVKLEDKLIVNKCFRIVMAGAAMSGRGDVAYGGSLEAQLRDRDYPVGRFLSTLGLSIMDWHGDLAIGGNVQTQIPIGRSTNLIARANLNNRGAGQISIRLNSSEQLQLALFGFIPLLQKVLDQLSQLQREQ